MTINIGFIGTGGFTRHHVQILSSFDHVNVVGFVGSSQEKAEKFAEEFSGTNGYASLEEMMAKEKLDAVYICVPPMGHESYEKTLIENQIPFFVEKPLGLEEEAVREIKHLVEERNHLTSVGYHFRYADIVDKWMELNHTVTTGMVTAGWMGSLPPVYWWKNQALSGGQFNEQTTHLVDLIRYLYGEVQSVYAVENQTSATQSDDTVTVADVGSFTLTMDSGIVVQVANTSVLPDGLGDVHIKAYTNKGMVTWRMKELEVATVGKKSIYSAKTNPYHEEAKAFLQAVETGDRSFILSSYEDAWQSFKIAIAARRSIEENRVIDLKEISD